MTMPELKKEIEADDPYEWVAVRFPAEPGSDPYEEMARCFIEEFALMGFPPERILLLFRSRAFAGTHTIWHERGEGWVRALIDETFGSNADREA